MSFRKWLEAGSKFRLLSRSSSIKQLIIMRGFPGSGKSTLAQSLGIGGVVFSTDDYFISPSGEYKYDQSLAGQHHKSNLDRATDAMSRGISPVVIDNTNVSRSAIEPYVIAGRKFGYTISFRESEMAWKDDPIELARRNSHGVPQSEIEKMMRQWEPSSDIKRYFKHSSTDR